MSAVTTSLKREAAIQGYSAWFYSILGEYPNITRWNDGAGIDWKPGQAKRMEKYFSDAMKSSPPQSGDLNVRVNWTPVFLPLAIKKTGLWLALFGAAAFLGGRYLWR